MKKLHNIPIFLLLLSVIILPSYTVAQNSTTNGKSLLASIYCATLGAWLNSPSCRDDVNTILPAYTPETTIVNQNFNSSTTPPSLGATAGEAIQPVSRPTSSYTDPNITSMINSAVQNALSRYSTTNSNSFNSNDFVTKDFLSRQIGAIGDSTGRTVSSVSSNITTSGTLTNPTISGATITGSSFAGTTGTFTGNVGIGTVSPQYALDIQGNSVLWQSTYSSDDGLIAYYPFSENATTTIHDFGPYGFDLTAVGTVPMSTTTGKVGNGMSFPGSLSSYYITPASVVTTALKPVKLTISAWTYPTSISTDTWSTIANYGNNNIYQFVYFDDQFIMNLRLNGANQQIRTPAIFPENNWYYAVTTYDGSYMRIYVNGVLQAEEYFGGDIQYQGSNYLYVGTYPGYNPFQGTMDELKIYGRALSIDEIKTQYLNQSNKSTFVSDKFRIFNTSLTELLRMTSTGNLGIGTTSPYVKLAVAGKGAFDDNVRALSFTATSTTATSTIGLGGLAVGTTTPFRNGLFTVGTTSTALIVDRFSGNTGLGTSSPFAKLSVVGTVAINGLTANSGSNYAVCINNTTKELTADVGGACNPSSERFKNNIQPLSVSATDIINSLKPSTFIYNNTDSSNATTSTKYGLIAEQVSLIDPHLATYEEDGITPHGLDTSAILSVLVKAVQELTTNLKNLIAETITAVVGNFQTVSTDNIQMKDKITGKIYCVSVSNGQLQTGDCENIEQVSIPTTSQISNTETVVTPTPTPEITISSTASPTPTETSVTSQTSTETSTTTSPVVPEVTPTPTETSVPAPTIEATISPTPTPEIIVETAPSVTTEPTPIQETTPSDL